MSEKANLYRSPEYYRIKRKLRKLQAEKGKEGETVES